MQRPERIGEWRGYRRFVVARPTLEHVVHHRGARGLARGRLSLDEESNGCKNCEWHGAGVEAVYIRLSDAERPPSPIAEKIQHRLGQWAMADAVGIKWYWDRGWRDSAFERQRAAARKGLAPLVFARLAVWGETSRGSGHGAAPVGFGILMEATRPPHDFPSSYPESRAMPDLSARGLAQGDMHGANVAYSDRLGRALCIDWGPCGGGQRNDVQKAPDAPGRELRKACGHCGRGHAPDTLGAPTCND